MYFYFSMRDSVGDLRFQLILLSAMPGICNTKKVENQGRKAKKSKVNVEPLSRCRFVFQKIRMEGVVCRDVLLEEDAAASALLAAGSVFSCMCVCVFAVSCLKTASTSVLAQQPNLQVESEVNVLLRALTRRFGAVIFSPRWRAG